MSREDETNVMGSDQEPPLAATITRDRRSSSVTEGVWEMVSGGLLVGHRVGATEDARGWLCCRRDQLVVEETSLATNANGGARR